MNNNKVSQKISLLVHESEVTRTDVAQYPTLNRGLIEREL